MSAKPDLKGTVKETNIGTEGSVRGGLKPAYGKYYPHMPGRNVYPNANVQRTETGPPSTKGLRPKNNIPFLPSKPETGKP